MATKQSSCETMPNAKHQLSSTQRFFISFHQKYRSERYVRISLLTMLCSLRNENENIKCKKRQTNWGKSSIYCISNIQYPISIGTETVCVPERKPSVWMHFRLRLWLHRNTGRLRPASEQRWAGPRPGSTFFLFLPSQT